ncbi:glucosaminidase domain-containing protein [Shewanella sp. NIFS-20-20]|uniref:glucosaminidase domain-containing protein n=1 Tax=Shewanella sp. NIFS-20-20 TaxID=2853806 RepID=UPI001C4890DD|nr:glucosaminidase domain-containing protein [Shewanella sp. NIFS-20-20]MBV7315702.1 glucosaminidase domain-containing protein [Shewanella sp. NIFS-20-20]
MKTGMLTKTLLALAAAIVIIYGLRVWLIPDLEIKQAKVATVVKTEVAAEKIPDFNSITDVKEKKIAFFDFLTPSIERENAIIAKERSMIIEFQQQLQAGNTLDDDTVDYLTALASKYKLTPQAINAERLQRLLKRVDVIPQNMVLIQAANESGWGTSRFARMGFNFFGQWCFKKGCGLVPLSRTEGMNHEVAKFDSVNASVSSYMRNLNTNAAYQTLRTIRLDMRRDGQEPNATALIHGLINYSERQGEYIDELLQMLQHNQDFLVSEG